MSQDDRMKSTDEDLADVRNNDLIFFNSTVRGFSDSIVHHQIGGTSCDTVLRLKKERIRELLFTIGKWSSCATKLWTVENIPSTIVEIKEVERFRRTAEAIDLSRYLFYHDPSEWYPLFVLPVHRQFKKLYLIDWSIKAIDRNLMSFAHIKWGLDRL